MPKVVFWMPVYNEGKYLANTINTVLNQTHPDIALIISDNFSTDNSREIIDTYIKAFPNIQLWSPPAHCVSLDHMNFIWERLQKLDADFFIHIGGHDWMDKHYAERLLAGYAANPTAALVCGKGLGLSKKDEVLGEYTGKTPQLIGDYKAFNPFSIVTLTTSNVAIHGLMPAATVRAVRFRYKCPGVDVLLVAEISTYGDVIFVPDAIFYQRISGVETVPRPGEDTPEHLKKHFGMSPDDEVAMVRVMNLQFRYISEVADLACARFPAEVRKIYKASLMGAYFIKWCADDYAHGALKHIGPIVEKFLGTLGALGDSTDQELQAFFAQAPSQIE